MNKIFRTALYTAVLNLAGHGAFAEAVDFSATLSNTCTLSLTSAGVMALSSDGVTLGSEESGGGSAIISVLSLGSNTLTIGAPSLLTSPFAYDETGQTVEIKYTGENGLAGLSQSYTDLETSADIGAIPQSDLTLEARIENANGFAAGSYNLRTVVTCF